MPGNSKSADTAVLEEELDPKQSPGGGSRLRSHITRFGAYATDELAVIPAAFNPVLKEIDFTTLDLAAA
jgi:hypothetical protein